MKKRRTQGILLAAAALTAIGLVAQAPKISFATGVQPILDRECTKCHDSKEHKGRLDLGASAAYKNLVGVPSAEVETMLRVKAGDPEASYLWLKLQHRAEKGSGMPKGLFFAKQLSAQEMDLIKAWIEGGAQP